MFSTGKKAFLVQLVIVGIALFSTQRARAQFPTPASIPIFQFEIFYEDDLEIRPGPNMTIDGFTHCNHDVYLSPGATLSFSNAYFSNQISAAGSIYNHKKAGDPESEGNGTTFFQGPVLTNIGTLNFGWSNLASNFTTGYHGVLDVPPLQESPTSLLGSNRFYNQVDLIVLVSNATVYARSGVAVNNSTTIIPPGHWTNFIRTNGDFYNVREASTVRAVTVDIAKFKFWSMTNTLLRPLLGNRDVSSIYIADMRSINATQQAGICLTNGKFLPSLGLTVVTPDPAYIIGDYNTSDDGTSFYPGTSDTTHTRPAAILCDAINILSWNFTPLHFTPTNTLSDGTRTAANTTVNAAFLSGIVPTTNISGGKFSGGVENFPRFLENWAGCTFTYNGSMVELFPSAIANSFWIFNGTPYNSYIPPVRNWSYDANFSESTKLPPLTPSVFPTAPVIFSGPKGTNLSGLPGTNGIVGQSYAFSVTVTNTPSVYQWYFKTNIAIVGATNSTLILTNLQTNQAGVYSVSISNAFTNPYLYFASPSTTAFITLTVASAPQILTSPQVAFLPPGRTNVFTVAATGTPPLQYQWLYLFTLVTNGVTNFYQTNQLASQTNSLSVVVGEGQDNYYAVVITNLYGSVTSTPVRLLAIYPPHASFSFPGQTVQIGQPAVFRAVPDGIPSPNVYWYKNGLQLPDGTNYSISNNVVTNGSLLTIPSATFADAGTYSVIVSNMAGMASTSAVLVVTKADSVTMLNPLPSSSVLAPVNLVASVNVNGLIPTGQVEFRDGTNYLGAATLSAGTAHVNGIDLAAGEHGITAFYAGDTNCNSSVSAIASQRLGFYLLSPKWPEGGVLSLTGSGSPGQSVVLESAENFTNTFSWLPVDTNMADTNGYIHFYPPSTNNVNRLYRMRSAAP